MHIDKRIVNAAKYELARRSFFEYCNVMVPSFYTRDRSYLVELCDTLQEFESSDDDVLVVNMPP